MNNKTFDCVELQHKGAEEIRKQTEGMTFEEEVEFWRRESELLKKIKEEVKKEKALDK